MSAIIVGLQGCRRRCGRHPLPECSTFRLSHWPRQSLRRIFESYRTKVVDARSLTQND